MSSTAWCSPRCVCAVCRRGPADARARSRGRRGRVGNTALRGPSPTMSQQTLLATRMHTEEVFTCRRPLPVVAPLRVAVSAPRRPSFSCWRRMRRLRAGRCTLSVSVLRCALPPVPAPPFHPPHTLTSSHPDLTTPVAPLGVALGAALVVFPTPATAVAGADAAADLLAPPLRPPRRCCFRPSAPPRRCGRGAAVTARAPPPRRAGCIHQTWCLGIVRGRATATPRQRRVGRWPRHRHRGP